MAIITQITITLRLILKVGSIKFLLYFIIFIFLCPEKLVQGIIYNTGKRKHVLPDTIQLITTYEEFHVFKMVDPCIYGLQIEKFIELWTNKNTGDSVLVLSKGTETKNFNSIRIIVEYIQWSAIIVYYSIFQSKRD